MAVTVFTPNLGLALPTTGDLSGTWGTTVNDAITTLTDTAVAGTTTLSSDADVTLTTTDGATNQARAAVILWTAGGTATRTITVPAHSKTYTVINKTTSTQSITIVGVTGAGVTVTAGNKAFVVWNGVDFVQVASSLGPFTQYGVAYASTTTALASTAAGTAGYVLTSNASSAPTFQVLPASGVSQAKVTAIAMVFVF